MSHTVRKGAYAFPKESEFWCGFRKGVLSGLDAGTVAREIREWKHGECTLDTGRSTCTIRPLAFGGIEVVRKGSPAFSAILIPEGDDYVTAWCGTEETDDVQVRCHRTVGRMIADLMIFSRACESCPELLRKGGEKA